MRLTVENPRLKLVIISALASEPPLPDPLQQPPPAPREGRDVQVRQGISNLVGGPALVVAGFAFLPTPGPSYIIIVMGLWMLAGELLPLARFFDRLEVRLRRLGGGIKGLWTGLPAVVKILLVFTFVAALGYVAYYLFFG